MTAQSRSTGRNAPRQGSDSGDAAERRTGAEPYICRCGHLSVQHTYCKYECHVPEVCACQEYEVQR